MEIGVRSEALALKDLLRPGRFFRLPAFQRSYAWDEAEAMALFSDLRDGLELGLPHFIGTIVLVEDEGTEGCFEIVDGQQRLTTLTILLAALRDLIRSGVDVRKQLLDALQDKRQKNGTHWRLTLNEFDAPFFRASVQESGATLLGIRDDDRVQSRERLYQNTRKIVAALRALSPKELADFAEYVVGGCSMVVVYVEDRETAARVYSTLNDRGKSARDHDILKTDILEKSGLSDEEQASYARAWASYEARVRDSGMDALLQNIRVIMEQGRPSGAMLAAFRRVVLGKMSAREFMEDVLPAYVDAETALQGKRLPNHPKPGDGITAAMHHFTGIEHMLWRSAVLKFIVHRGDDLESARQFFPLMERLTWAHQLVFTEKKQRERRYKRVIEAVDDDEVLFGDDSPLVIHRDEAKKISERLLGRFTSIGQRRALVMRVNAAMPGGEIVSSRSDVSVEHVLPKSPEEGNYWLTVWPNHAVRTQLTESLGNFVLLPKEVNTKADRHDYRSKLDVYFENGAGDAYAITRDLKSIPNWSPDVVRKRTVRLANYLLKAWGLDQIPNG